MKEKLKKLIEQKELQLKDLKERSAKSESVQEVRALGEDIDKIISELNDLKDMYAKVEEPAPKTEGDDERAFKPLASMGGMRGADVDGDDKYGSVAYRRAFMDKLCRNVDMPKEYRASAATNGTNNGTVIPTNLSTQIIEKFEQLGIIYNLVTKTNYPVGQTIPVDGVKPVATWVTEGAGSTPQGKTMNVAITFTHYKLRCEIRFTEEMATMAMPQWEAMFVKQVSEAMLRAVEGAIVDGDGTTKPKGILTYTAPAGQAITIDGGKKLTYQTLCDAEAAVPVNYETTAKWCMTKKTFMAFIGMTDTNGQPIARVNYGINGKAERTLLGREVVIYAPQTGSKLGNYADTVSVNTIFAFICDFSDYVLNNNYNLGVSHALDWDNEDHKTKAVAAYDGKLIITDSLVTLTKATGTPAKI